MRRCTQKQERFCLKYLELGSGREAARQAGYSPKWTSRTSRDVLASPQVQARLEELKKRIGDDERLAIMSRQERMERLSEIARAVVPDFVNEEGIKVSHESPNVAAVQEITTKTKVFRKGGEPVIITNLKLHNPVQAIDLLNKMDGVYSENPPPNVNNTQINIFVVDNETKELISRVAERTLSNGNANNQSLQGNSEGMGRTEEGDTTGGGNI